MRYCNQAGKEIGALDYIEGVVVQKTASFSKKKKPRIKACVKYKRRRGVQGMVSGHGTRPTWQDLSKSTMKKRFRVMRGCMRSGIAG